MSEPEESIDELAHEITVAILKRLESKMKLGTMSLSNNYHCTGLKYECGRGYHCTPKDVHSCSNIFWCFGFVETNHTVP